MFYTNRGNVRLELYPERAPSTVENFLGYVNSAFYDETLFYRVVAGFVTQGGGVERDLREKTTGPPIELEAGISNQRGTIAMARTSDPNSATADYFINLKDNDHLNASPTFHGYAVFGRVTEGMRVVDLIGAAPTVVDGQFESLPMPLIVVDVALAVPSGEPTPVLERVPSVPIALEMPGGAGAAVANAINDAGVTVGELVGSTSQAAIWWTPNSSPVTLAPLEGDTESYRHQREFERTRCRLLLRR